MPARLIAPLTHLLAPHCSLYSHSLLRSIVRSLTHKKEVYVCELNASTSKVSTYAASVHDTLGCFYIRKLFQLSRHIGVVMTYE